MSEDEARPTQEVTYSSILEEHDVVRTQRAARKDILEKLAAPEQNDGHKKNGVIAHVSHGALLPADVPVFGSALLSIGDVDTLNLILHSPGGDGTSIKKIVSLCRAQCKRFRVIVPNKAKSAATIIALGADEIVMGPPSELGPIDAQIEVIIGGIPRYMSAQSFIDARVDLLKQHNDLLSKKKDTSATLQMLATLDHSFIAECERMMDFGRDVGRQLLEDGMFASVVFHSK